MEEQNPLRIILTANLPLPPSIVTPLMPGMLELLESKRRVVNDRNVGPRVVMDGVIGEICGKVSGFLGL